MGGSEWNSSANDYSVVGNAQNPLPYTLSTDHVPTTFTPQNSEGAYHADLQGNFSALRWNNRLTDINSNYANSSPLSAPVRPTTSAGQWTALYLPATAFRAGQFWNYSAQTNSDFLASRSAWDAGQSLYRTINGSVVSDAALSYFWSHHQYNRSAGNGPFTLSATGALAKITLTGYRDFKSILPWFTTNVGGLPSMSKDRVNDAVARASVEDSYLVYYPSAATTLTTMPDAAKGAGWENGWLAHQWYEPSGDPIYVKYRDGDLISRNGHNTVFTVSRNKISGVEAVIK